MPGINRRGIRDSNDDNVAYGGAVTFRIGTGTGPYRC
jgi:hypothetical protein